MIFANDNLQMEGMKRDRQLKLAQISIFAQKEDNIKRIVGALIEQLVSRVPALSGCSMTHAESSKLAEYMQIAKDILYFLESVPVDFSVEASPSARQSFGPLGGSSSGPSLTPRSASRSVPPLPLSTKDLESDDSAAAVADDERLEDETFVRRTTAEIICTAWRSPIRDVTCGRYVLLIESCAEPRLMEVIVIA